MSQELDFALIRQKDHILGLVRDEEYEKALTLLDFSANLWLVASYGYKTEEIRQIIRRAVQEHLLNCSHWKQKEKYQKLLVRV